MLSKPMSQATALKHLQKKLGYPFSDSALLQRALTHPSYLQDHPEEEESNQRLEFLGDAVLQLLLTEILYKRFPAEREGQLSRRRSILTRGSSLATKAREIGIPKALRLGNSEESTGGQDKASLLEDAMEAILGAIHLDGGIEASRAVVRNLFQDIEESLELAAADSYQAHDNPKGLLQERVQPLHGNQAITYELLGTSGPDHDKTYKARVSVMGQVLGMGQGSSKKAAETEAARDALRTWDASNAGDTHS